MSQGDVLDFLAKDKRRWYTADNMEIKLKSQSLSCNLKKLREFEMVNWKKVIPPKYPVMREIYMYRWKR